MAGHNHRQVVAGIEKPEFVRIHFGKLGGRLHVDVTAFGDAHKVGFVFDFGELDAVLVRIGHDFSDRFKARHVVGRLARHSQVRVVGLLPARLGAADGSAHAAFAPVVGGQGELPVPELGVEFFQIVQSRARALQHVAPLVAPEVLLQRIDVARLRHELPQARGLGVRERFGLKRAFHKGQKRKFRGQAPLLDFSDDVIEVFARALENTLDLAGIARIAS